MPIRKKTAAESLERVFNLYRQIDDHLQNILNNADKEGFSRDVCTLRDRLQSQSHDINTQRKITQDIVRTLASYNDEFAQVVLIFIKQKISEYRKLNILQNYKASA